MMWRMMCVGGALKVKHLQTEQWLRVGLRHRLVKMTFDAFIKQNERHSPCPSQYEPKIGKKETRASTP
jgi:hypothetical protein